MLTPSLWMRILFLRLLCIIGLLEFISLWLHCQAWYCFNRPLLLNIRLWFVCFFLQEVYWCINCPAFCYAFTYNLGKGTHFCPKDKKNRGYLSDETKQAGELSVCQLTRLFRYLFTGKKLFDQFESVLCNHQFLVSRDDADCNL